MRQGRSLVALVAILGAGLVVIGLETHHSLVLLLVFQGSGLL